MQQDYIAIVAALSDSHIPIVRQYRPTLESFTWELPAGLVEFGRGCGRMLPPRTHGGDWFCRSRRACVAGGACAGVLCTLHARLSNRVHSFYVELYVELDPIAEGKPAEPVIELKPVSPAQNDLAVRRALETAGVEFIDDNGGGPGVRLRKRQLKKG